MRYVVVGGGLAGQRAVEVLRRKRPDASIVLASSEDQPPYDRPPLSKEFLRGDQTNLSYYQQRDWYAANRIDLRLGESARRLDPAGHSVTFSTGERVEYDTLLCATGARPRRLNIPGSDLPGIFYLRAAEDACRLRTALEHARGVVVIGAGFIGVEVAASCRERGVSVSIVEALQLPLVRALGETLGHMYLDLHRRHGVDARMSTGVAGFGGTERVEYVVTDDGARLPCDVVVVGIGVVPQTEWLAGSGIHVDNGIVVDEWCETNVPNVFAAGDVARWPYRPSTRCIRLEHWDNASNQGDCAAQNMTSHNQAAYDPVPYFWSDQYGLRLQYIGHAAPGDQCIFRGNIAEWDFIGFYLNGGMISGAVGVNRGREIVAARRLISGTVAVDLSKLQDDRIPLKSLL